MLGLIRFSRYLMQPTMRWDLQQVMSPIFKCMDLQSCGLSNLVDEVIDRIMEEEYHLRLMDYLVMMI